MKFSGFILTLSLTALAAGCSSLDGNVMQAGLSGLKAATLSDDEVISMSNEACADADANSPIAPSNSAYNRRLNKIASSLGNEIAGIPVNYKVYMIDNVNAWAMANGCIRVYSGLMDKMNDDEVAGVFAHEMGHVALGHSRRAMQVAYAASAGRSAAASSSNAAVSSAARSDLGGMTQALISAQFSQSQEFDADEFALDLIIERNMNPQGLATAFDKLSEMGSSNSSMFDSHPGSDKRATRIRNMIAERQD
ncbi:M48 family metalloprotease [Halopseudomonas salegens]|uniref:Putative metalloprotease n=1 Tax=Halopseudomonas salegens TaxID=1434072 RepID=A0A1H2HCQ9_9GAMM|nr:M48 family metalloprotease [Halopseudomonas salegens]SDU29582.1 putative metalloprotease [Halopseudomonas salegens]